MATVKGGSTTPRYVDVAEDMDNPLSRIASTYLCVLSSLAGIFCFSFSQQLRRIKPHRVSDSLQRAQGDISFSPFHRADVSAVQLAKVSKLFLGDASGLPVSTDIVRQDLCQLMAWFAERGLSCFSLHDLHISTDVAAWIRSKLWGLYTYAHFGAFTP